jgi:hypothetical protein
MNKKMTWQELVKEYFPEATNDDVQYILWNETSFPYFWNIPEDGLTGEECCRKQLKELKEKV